MLKFFDTKRLQTVSEIRSGNRCILGFGFVSDFGFREKDVSRVQSTFWWACVAEARWSHPTIYAFGMKAAIWKRQKGPDSGKLFNATCRRPTARASAKT